MKKRLRTRFIISGVIFIVLTIGCGILFASGEDHNFGEGVLCGALFGLVFGGVFPHIGFIKKKEDDE